MAKNILRLPDELRQLVIKIFIPHYQKAKKEGGDEYFQAGTFMGVPLLNDLYEKNVESKEIEPIENLPKERKEKYWRLSAKYFKDKTDRTKSSKAMYMLDELGAE